MRKVILTTALILFFILLGTAVAVFYAKGYRVIRQNGRPKIEGTGLLVLTSRPDGARVFINSHLTTATNNTINLAPGDYEVKIEKDGYFSWKKKIAIKKEVVSEATAVLFPIAPKLESITQSGANNPVRDNTGTLIAYTSLSTSVNKSGAFILDMNARPLLTLGGLISQIVDNTLDKFSASTLTFSPDGSQLLASISAQGSTTYYLLSARSTNQNPQDVTATFPQLEREWERQKTERAKKLQDSLPKNVRQLSLSYFQDIVLSPEENKILYTASRSANLPLVIQPRLAAVNSTAEDRNLKIGNLYVYDIKEDRNFLIFDQAMVKKDGQRPQFLWHPDSRHLIYSQDKKIHIVEYDGQNDTVVYAAPFVDEFVFPWPDGSSLVILTNLSIPDAPNNLYRISLK